MSAWTLIALSLPGVPLPDATPFVLLGSLGAMIFGMGKVGFGGGVGILAVPLMIIACGGDSSLALGLMLPLLIAADYCALAAWWRQWQWRSIAQLLPGVVVGIALGGGVIAWLKHIGADTVTDAGLKLIIGIIALGFVVLRALQWRFHRMWTFRPVPWQAGVSGTLVGVTSTLAHAAGPVATMYLLSQRLDKRRLVATNVCLFWIVNQLKLVPYGLLGLVRTDTLAMGLWLVPGVVAGAILGRGLNRRLGERSFAGIIYVLLSIAGIHMIAKGLETLLAG